MMCVNKGSGHWCRTAPTNVEKNKCYDEFELRGIKSSTRLLLATFIFLLSFPFTQAQVSTTPSPTPRRRRPIITFSPSHGGFTVSPTSQTVATTPPPTSTPTRPARTPAPTRRTSSPTRRGTTPPPSVQKTMPPSFGSEAPSFASQMPSPQVFSDTVSMYPTYPIPTSQPSTTPRPTTEFAPSTAPSARPSMPLSDMTRIAYKAAKAKMTLHGVTHTLNGQAAGEWVGVTAAHLSDFIKSRLEIGHFAYLQVTVRMVSQQVLFAPQVTDQNGNIFTRQQPSLGIGFNVDISMLSLKEHHDVASYLTGGFNTEQRQASYVKKLIETDEDPFDNTISALVEVLWVPERVENFLSPTSAPTVEGSETEEPQDSVDDSESGERRNTLLFVISVVSACAGMGILLLLYFRVKDAREKKSVPLAQTCDYESEVESNQYVSEIDVAFGSGDVSTLGAPSLANLSIFSLRPVAKVRKVKIREGSLAWQLEQRQIETDAPQGEVRYRAFEIDAPAGVLGLVLETKSSGVPTVQIIRECSILKKHVNIGDQLLSVDGEDVTVMNKDQVSELMAEKQHNRSRRMLFRRQRKKRHKRECSI